MTTTDEAMLLAAIVANYEEDTPRLVYADWLEEQEPVRVKCPRCNGSRSVFVYSNGTHEACVCINCMGGTVIDTSNDDRAELIRIQIERVRSGNALHGAEITSAILNRHPDWSRVKCPDCREGGCGTCHKVGDLLKFDSGESLIMKPRPIRWSRGFIEVVEARSEEVLYALPVQRGHLNPVVPSPWARAIVAAIPTLREIRLTDREPGHYETRPHEWYLTRLQGGYSQADYAAAPQIIPPPIWDLLTGFLGGPDARVFARRYTSREAAVTALGRSVCDWARSHLTAGPASPPSPRDPASP